MTIYQDFQQAIVLVAGPGLLDVARLLVIGALFITFGEALMEVTAGMVDRIFK